MSKQTREPVLPPEPRDGERSETALGGGGSTDARRHDPGGAPDPELTPRAQRRRFGAAYKLRIVREADACTRPGEIGTLLRREGLYTSHLSAWRRARDQGQLEGLAPRKRGPKLDPDRPLSKRNAQLERENARLRRRLETAKTIIEVQGNVSRLLGLTMPESEIDS